MNSIVDKSDTGESWLTNNLRENFQSLNNGDMMLYKRMNRSLWQEVDKIGRAKVLQEEKELIQLNIKLEKRCTNGTYKVGIEQKPSTVFLL